MNYQSWALWIVGVLLKLLFFVNWHTTVALLHLWFHHIVNYIISTHMWDRYTVRNAGLPFLAFSSPVGLLPSSLCNRNFQSYRNIVNSGSWDSCQLQLWKLPKSCQQWELTFLSTALFRATNIPVNFKSWYSCNFESYLTPRRHYGSRELLELPNVAFEGNKILSIVGVGIPVNCSFQSY